MLMVVHLPHRCWFGNAYHLHDGRKGCGTKRAVDQLEDRYLGMVEAPSSNLGTSTFFFIDNERVPLGY